MDFGTCLIPGAKPEKSDAGQGRIDCVEARMENRFGIKDFILIVLVAGLIVIVLLAMKQYDRQWDKLQSIEATLEGQGRDLREVQNAIARGVVMRGGAGVATTQSDDAFARLRTAQAMSGYSQGDWLVDTFPGQVAKLT